MLHTGWQMYQYQWMLITLECHIVEDNLSKEMEASIAVLPRWHPCMATAMEPALIAGNKDTLHTTAPRSNVSPLVQTMLISLTLIRMMPTQDSLIKNLNKSRIVSHS